LRIEKGIFHHGYASQITKPASIKSFLAANDNLRDKNSALYYPRVQVPDPLNSFGSRSFDSSGKVAGLCGPIDSARGVWIARSGSRVEHEQCIAEEEKAEHAA
jgi:phage tail sheath protein FI